MSLMSRVAFIVALAFSAVAGATPVYKYFLRPNDLIAEKCNDGGETVSSKINLTFSNPQEAMVETRLQIKACTLKFGLKKFSLIFNMPVALLDENTLLGLRVGSTQKIGLLDVTRELDLQGLAVYSLSPASFGPQAAGVQVIRFFVPLATEARQQILMKTQGAFVWSGISLTYKKNLLMPTVNLSGELTMVEEE